MYTDGRDRDRTVPRGTPHSAPFGFEFKAKLPRAEEVFSDENLRKR